jgi:Phosphotransferase enzyme family
LATPEQISEAFDLGRPVEQLIPVQHTVSQTWRMTTTRGSFLVKQIWPDHDPPWAHELVEAMRFEQRASAAGIRTPPTVPPVEVAFGWTGRVAGRGAFRVTEWVEHRKVTDDDDLSDWLGWTLATLHSFQAYAGSIEPHYYIYPAEHWRAWSAQASEQQRPWAFDLASHLDDYLAITARLRATFVNIDDHVITHRDMVPFNVLITSEGPVLTDWEVIGPDSASLEAGFAAVTFGRRNTGYVRRILDAYRANGGSLVAGLGEYLFAHKLGSELGRLANILPAVLEASPLRGWQTRFDDPDEGVSYLLQEVLSTAGRLDKLAAELRGS